MFCALAYRLFLCHPFSAFSIDAIAGKMISETECQMCPGGDEEGGCCTIDMESFDFGCDVCENIGGELECARVQCGLNDSGGYGCNGCGEYSSGEACFDFSCDGASDGEADCTCNGITWNDQDCGECVIDKNDNPVFDCSAVGGPSSDSSPSNFVGALAAIIIISAFGVIANLIY